MSTRQERRRRTREGPRSGAARAAHSADTTGDAGARRSDSGYRSPLLATAAGLLVAASALFIFLPTLRFGFLTSWDDPTYVVNNPWIRGFTREHLTFVFTRPYFANFLPLHLLSYMVDYTFWKLNPFGYHLQSVLLHVVNSLLALILVRRLGGSALQAFLASLFFAVHPSHVEAVAWVSIRKDLLATVFLFLTVIFYERATRGRRVEPRAYVGSVVSFGLGLLSKVSIAALPAFLFVLDAFRSRGARPLPWKTSVLTKVPYGVLALWLTLLNSAAQVTAKAAYAHDPLRYLMVKGHAVWNYLALLTGAPMGRPIYDLPALPLDLWTIVWNLAGLLVLPAVFWIALQRGLRTVYLGAAWIFILLLPALLFPLVTYMADRYLYAPSLGFCWILAAGITAVARPIRAVPARVAAVAALAVLPFGLFVQRTIATSRIWTDSETLWTYTLAHSRDFRAANNLAQVRLDQKRWGDAERLYRRAMGVENVVSYQGLAVLYYDTHRYDEAQRMIDKALLVALKKHISPDELAELHYTRGAIFWVRGKRPEAVASWEEALRQNPQHSGALEWLRTARGTPG